MMDLISLLIIFASVIVGWGIGANSASNAISPLAGLKIISFRAAALLVSVLMLLGALLQSGAVINTVGDGIIPREVLEANKLATLSSLLATAVFVVLVTTEAIPVSASQAVIGALLGSGLSMGLLGSLDVSVVSRIFLAWLLTPVMSLLLAIIIYVFFINYMSKRIGLVAFSETFRFLVLLGTAFVAFSLGANNAGNAAGLLISSGVFQGSLLPLILVGLAMGFGVSSFGGRVANTVGRNITLIDPVTVFASQFAAGITVYFFTLIGIPVSASQAIIGGLVGVGMTKGSGMINDRLVVLIFIGWVITPIGAAILSAVIYRILAHLFLAQLVLQ